MINDAQQEGADEEELEALQESIEGDEEQVRLLVDTLGYLIKVNLYKTLGQFGSNQYISYLNYIID